MGNDIAIRGKKSSFVDVQDIVKNQSSRTKLQSYIDEIVVCKTKILDQNEAIRGIREAAAEELGIQPKLLMALVNVFFNNNFEEKRSELEQLDAAISALMQTGQISKDD